MPVAQASSPVEATETTPSGGFAPGRYLFGEAPRPDQLGRVYAVFAVEGEQITGAFYMPQSSFDCFQGRAEGDRLALRVRNSYEQTVFPYAIGLTPGEAIASRESASPAPGLAGFHRIEALSPNDERILSVCQAETW